MKAFDSRLLGRRIDRYWPLLIACLLPACRPNSPETMVETARRAIDDGNPIAAAVSLKAALQVRPGDRDIRFQLGQLLLNGGDPVGAELEFRKAGELGLDPARVQPLIARALIEQSKPEAVIREFAAADFPPGGSDAAIKAALAEAHGALGKREESLRLLRQALESDPRSVPARLLEVRRLLAVNDEAAADAVLADVLAEDPKNTTAWLLRGDLDKRRSAEPGAALESYRKALEADRYSIPAQVAFLRALVASKKLDEAERQLKVFKAAFPRHPQVQFFTALLSFERGQIDAAREAAIGLLKVAPEAPLALQLAGAIELRRGNLLLANSYLGRVVTSVPAESAPRLLLARTLMRQRNFTRALTVLQPLLEEQSPLQDALAMAGEALIHMGNAQKAAALLEKAVKAKPDDTRARSVLALSRIDTGNLKEGLDDLRKLTEVDSTATADLALISSLFVRQRWVEALQAVDVLERKNPGSADPANLRGRIELARGDHAKARAAFSTALERDPAFLEAANNLVALDIADGLEDNAIKRFEAVVAARPNNLAARMALWRAQAANGQPLSEQAGTLAGLVREYPDDVAPRLALAKVQVQTNEYGLALTTVQSALTQFPEHTELLDALAQLQMQAGQTHQAIASINRILSREPGSVVALMRMAELLARQGDARGSQQYLRKVLVVDPSYTAALRTLVDMEISAGKVGSARQMIDAHLKLRPRDPDLLILRGDLDLTQKDWIAAIGRLKQALALRPNTQTASKVHRTLIAGNRPADADRFAEDWLRQNPRDSQFLRYLGDLALGQGRQEQAQRHYREVLKLKPRDAATLNNLAWTLLSKEPSEALGYAKQAVELQRAASHYDTLAEAYAALKQWKPAVEAQRTAVALERDNGVAGMRLARLLHRSGDTAAALDALRSLKPGTEGVSEAEVERLRDEWRAKAASTAAK